MYKTRGTQNAFIGTRHNVWCPSPPYTPYTRAYGYTGNASAFYYGFPYENDGELFAEFCDTKYQRALDGYAGVSTPGLFATYGSEYFQSTERGRPIYNDCDHFRGRYTSYTYGAYSPHARLAGWRVECYAYRDDPYPYAPLSSLEHTVGVELNAVRGRAWWEMQPRFEGEVNMLNFLFELKDFKDIVKLATKTLKSPRWLNVLRSKKAVKKALKDPSRPAAESILTYNFGIAPFVKDMGDIIKQCNEIVRDAQQQFFDDGTDLQKSHYSELVNEDEDLTTSSAFYGTRGQHGWREQTIFTATLEYKYNYSMRSQHDAFLKYWGLTGSFEAFWNMIPGSFLVDYFIKIGQALHAMETDPNVELVQNQYCESLLTSFEYGKFATGLSGCIHFVRDGVSIDSSSYHFVNGAQTTRYTRWRKQPFQGIYIPKLSLPSGKQGLNMLALARTFL